jgi:hypothetical protein
MSGEALDAGACFHVVAKRAGLKLSSWRTGMSPNDRKAIRLCAQLMGVSEDGYDPIHNDKQAKALLVKLGLELRYLLLRGDTKTQLDFRQMQIFKADGSLVCNFTGMTENAAIVNGACYAHDQKWYDKP